MPKITFMGAGSTIFAKRILGDSLVTPALWDCLISLYDIDPARLSESKMMLDNLNENINGGRAKITAHLGPASRKAALKGADYVVNAINVGGYKPSTVIDFEIPKKYGLRQTIADTMGIGGVFRALRTIPVMLDFARDIEKVCPKAWFLNYTNPMAIITGAMLRGTAVKTVGLCHSVQDCASDLLKIAGMEQSVKKLQHKIAGINHMAWLLEITDDGKDLYPEIKKRTQELNLAARQKGAKKHEDMVRLEIMRHFGYYVTESSHHTAEYSPYWIKSGYPELIEEFNIPLDLYPGICVRQIEGWQRQRDELVNNKKLSHERTKEYGSYIMEAMETNQPACVNGNIINKGFITNLPANAVVEVPSLVDRNGVQGCFVGALPTQCAALNMTNINMQLMTVEAALTCKREAVYQAAMLDPHTAAELSLDRIRQLCDDMFEAHGDILPKFK
jgi:alpha-galactosidase